MEKDKGRFYWWQWFLNIVRNGLFWYGVHNRLARIGIMINPYYWELENTGTITSPKIKGNTEEFIVDYLSLEEIEALISRIKGIRNDEFIEGIKRGQKCIGLRHKGEIAAYMCIDFKSFEYNKREFQLKSNEAYLLNMYTFEKFRGRNLAPYLRFKSYELLQKANRDTIYSITVYFNKSSLRFKKKLGVKHLKLYLYIGLFKKINWNFRLRTFDQ